jgi:hypothetical protein
MIYLLFIIIKIFKNIITIIKGFRETDSELRGDENLLAYRGAVHERGGGVRVSELPDAAVPEPMRAQQRGEDPGICAEAAAVSGAKQADLIKSAETARDLHFKVAFIMEVWRENAIYKRRPRLFFKK